jgi:flagellar protein FliO/FliZ
MRLPFKSFTDALRRLPMVIGCVVLATAQPMSAFAEPAAPAPAPDTVIYPKGSPEPETDAPRAASRSSGTGSTWLAVAMLIALAGGWLVIKRRAAGGAGLLGNRSNHKLQIDETRSLGNRQYLVVASYEGRKFLLGVTTGQIQMLTPLDDKTPEPPEAAR